MLKHEKGSSFLTHSVLYAATSPLTSGYNESWTVLHYTPCPQRITTYTIYTATQTITLVAHWRNDILQNVFAHITTPVYITELCQPCSNTSLWSAFRGDFSVARSNRRFTDSSFSIVAPSLWNCPPTHILSSTTFTLFSFFSLHHMFSHNYCTSTPRAVVVWRQSMCDGFNLICFASCPMLTVKHHSNHNSWFIQF